MSSCLRISLLLLCSISTCSCDGSSSKSFSKDPGRRLKTGRGHGVMLWTLSPLYISPMNLPPFGKQIDLISILSLNNPVPTFQTPDVLEWVIWSGVCLRVHACRWNIPLWNEMTIIHIVKIYKSWCAFIYLLVFKIHVGTIPIPFSVTFGVMHKSALCAKWNKYGNWN